MNLLTSKNHSNSLSLFHPSRSQHKSWHTFGSHCNGPVCLTFKASTGVVTRSLTLSLTPPRKDHPLSLPLPLFQFSLANLWTQGLHTNTSFCLSPTNHQDMTPRPSFKQRGERGRETVDWLPPLVRLHLACLPLPLAVAVVGCVCVS